MHGMSGGYEHAAESIVTIHAALEAGITMLDIGDFSTARDKRLKYGAR